jgi:nitrogen fixation protein FixH
MMQSSTARNTVTMSTTMTDLARPQRRSLWIPALFVGLMLLVVVVNGTMMYFAESTFSGLDTDQAYQEGIQYNTILKDAEASAALGWTAKTTVTPAGAGRHLAVSITDKSGKPVQGLELTAHLVRPVSTAFDQRLTLRAEGNGVYGTDVTLPVLGSWELRLAAETGATDWQVVQRIFMK